MFLKHCICRTISKQFIARPDVVKLDEFMDDAQTTGTSTLPLDPKKFACTAYYTN